MKVLHFTNSLLVIKLPKDCNNNVQNTYNNQLKVKAMENLKMTLTKTRDYELKPFGRFRFKWENGRDYSKKMNLLEVRETTIEHVTGMPYTPEQYDIIVKYMKKHKSDILIDKYNDCYTIMSDKFVRVSHKKITMFKTFLSQRDIEDYENETELWNEFIGK